MSQICFVCVLLTVLLLGQSDCARRLPETIQPCKLKDPELSKCWKDVVQSLKPHLVKGIRELQVPPIDPLLVQQLILSRNDSNVVVYKVDFSNLLVKGGKDFEIVDNSIDLTGIKFGVKVRVPKLIVTSKFVASGTLLGFPLNGPGSAVINFDNPVINFETEGEKTVNKGKTYIDWKDGKTGVSYDKVVIKAEEIIQDAAQLNLFNIAVNDNIDLLASHIDPVIKSSFGSYIGESLKQVHKLFPLSVLYPDS